MKRNLNSIILALLAGAALMVSACTNKEDPGKEQEPPKTEETAKITVLSGQAPVIADAGDSFTVEFSASLPWKVTPAATWVTVDPSSGNAGERCSVTVTVLENKTYNERSSKVTLSCGEGDNTASAEVSFTQKQKGALILSPSEVFVDAAGELVEIKVQTTSELTVTIEESAKSWITLLDTKDLTENVLSFQIAANEDYDPREGVITFSNDTGSDQITVKQVAKGALIISDSEINVDSEGEVITIKVTANAEVSYEIEESAKSWITPSTTKGLVENELQFTIAANEDYDPREGVISFSSEAGKQDVTVKQAAKGALILTQKEYNVGAAGELISVTVKANSNVSFEISQSAQSWITESTTKGLVENVLQFQIAANEDYDPREGTITFSNEAGSDVVTIKQAANGALFVDPVSFELDYNGGEISFTVQASSEVTVTVASEAQDWIIPASTKALTTDTYEFVVLENTAFVSRTGQITVSSSDGEQTVTVTQGEAPSSTLIEISSVAEFLEFAQKYNAGDYKEEVVPLQILLKENLAFDETSSASFNAIGGIGLKIMFGDEEDYYFNGTFEGNNKTISGLDATAPLFKATGDGGIVQNLTIDNTCSFVFTHPNVSEADYGAVAGYHKGTISNVTVDANVALAGVDGVTQNTAVGGLVGRVTVGVVENSSYNGSIVVPSTFSSSNLTHVAGLVGQMTNEAGVVKNSSFNGNIETEARVASTDKNNPYLFIGGIVGKVSAGTVDGCVTTNHPKTVLMANSKEYSGTIINHTTLAYHTAQGGIVGMNVGTVTGCTNEATIQSFVLTTGSDGTASDANSRYYDLGGIVGLNRADGVISGCINNAAIETRSAPRIQKIGGVVGYNLGAVSSSSNTVNGSIYISTTNIAPYSLRVGEVGGVIGNNANSSVENISNAGNIRMDRTENAAGVELKFGGVIGLTSAAIDGGSGKSISNSGNISDEYNGTTVTTAGLRFGGVVGSAQASVKNVVNTGALVYQLSSTNVLSKLFMGGIAGEARVIQPTGDGAEPLPIDIEISGCENSGEVYLNVNGKNAAHTDNYIGGILGKSFDCNVTLNNCSNSGEIHGGNKTKQNSTSCFTGGIVAYLDGVSSISGCSNSGNVYNDQFTNTVTETVAAFTGGIAGYAVGTAEAPIAISNCEHSVAALASRRGYQGGIIGFGNYVNVSDSKNIAEGMGGSVWYSGGIAGWLKNSSVVGCDYTGTEIFSSQIQPNAGGGIAARLDASVIDGCKSYVTDIYHVDGNIVKDADVEGGAIIGISGDGNTVKNCRFKATINGLNANIAGTGSFTDGGGNAADL